MAKAGQERPLEILERYYSALKSGDRSAISETVSEDIVVSYPGPSDLLPWGGEWNGKPEFFDFLDTVAEFLEILEVNPIRTEEFENGILVLLKGRWRVKSTGKEVTATVANVFDISGGLITKYQVFNDTAAFGKGLGKLS